MTADQTIPRDEVRRALALPALAALRCIPDGEIRHGCLRYDGAQVRDALRAAYLKLVDADPSLTVPDLEPEIRTEWGVWWHGGDWDGTVLSADRIGHRAQAVEQAEARIGDYGIDRYTIVRCEHHRFPPGAPFDVAITPWVVDERVTPEPATTKEH